MTPFDKPSAALLPEVSFTPDADASVAESSSESAIQVHQSIQDGAVERLIAQFEATVQHDGDGVEFWDSRDLAKLLDYDDYGSFLDLVAKAQQACRTTGVMVEDHFVITYYVPDIDSGTEPVVSIQLSRYACYLIAQNGDSSKQPVAFAHTYFAVQTRRREADDEEEGGFAPLPEDVKRLLLRTEIKEHNKHLASAAKDAGVIQPLDYAIFQNHGYKGLYGGLDAVGIRRKKGLRARQHILDFMGSTELAANLFRATQTEEKLRRDNVKGKAAANLTHFEVGKYVRATIKQIGGTMPEELPCAEDIAKVGRRMKAVLADSDGPAG